MKLGRTILALGLPALACHAQPTSTPEAPRLRPTEAPMKASRTPTDTSARPEPTRHEIDDAEITAALQRELLLDPAIPTQAVRIRTTDGIVELTGTVPHLYARERAVRKVEIIRGVRAVSNRLEVETPTRPDAAIAADLELALKLDPVTDVEDTTVDVEDQRVTLGGEVDSWAEREEVERIAKTILGVKEVHSQVAIAIGEPRSDKEIARDVQARLRWDALVDIDGIEVHVGAGTVTLTGAVSSAAEKRRVMSDAWAAGARAVDADALQVQWWRAQRLHRQAPPNPSQAEVAAAIEASAQLDPRVDAADIRVEVDGSTVTLTGTVPSLRARRAAVQLARDTVGVVEVVDELRVVPATVADRRLRGDVGFALTINPITHAAGIDVKVDGGRVVLRGRVETFALAAEAVDVAGRVRGVAEVVDALEVADPSRAFHYDAYAYPFYPHLREWAVYSTRETSRSDDDIKAAIERELAWSPWVRVADLQVDVDGGVATLRGTVRGTRARDAARTNAIEGGAISVVDRLDVRW
jgi:osmotically-inducible protein OsmY